MKLSVLILATCLSALTIKAQDLPNPAANLQTLPAGSYIIPMDNTLQNDVALGSNGGKFNLRSYGLVVHLLNYNVKIKWVMKAGKAKDAADFTATAQMFKPLLEASANSRNFIAAPFVIFAADTLGVASLINTYYSQAGLINHLRPKVFRTTTSTSNVDIRYDLTGFKPKAAILDDGGNEDIHVGYMIAASIPVINYSISDGASLQQNCFTFASEPHNGRNGAIVDSAIVHIKDFVLSGRNFLAECKAVVTYENNPLGRFTTTTGVDNVNRNLSTNVNYLFPDLSFYQFQGNYNASSGGSVKNWEVLDANNVPMSKAAGLGSFANVQAAVMAKLTPANVRGGLVFYLGNHEFANNNETGINGIRMYLNAFLTPVAPNSFCETDPNVLLPLKLTSFAGYLTNNKVTLNWTVAENQFGEQFKVEKSIDGKEFTSAALVFTTEKNGDESYGYFEQMPAPKSFYRIRMTDKSGVLTYSKVLMFETTALVANDLKLLNNPVQDKLNFKYETGTIATVEIKILDLTGRPVFQQKMNTSKGTNMVSLPVPGTLTKGMYIITVQDGAVQRSAKFVKN